MAELSGQLDMGAMLAAEEPQEPIEGYDENGNLMDYNPNLYEVIPAEDADRLRYLAAGIRSDFDAAKERVLHAGMLLMEARNRCPQGRWLEWLNKEAGCPERTAQQAMQLYETYGARELPEAYGKLDASHLVELLRAPEADRDALAAKAAEQEMSTRALREEIKKLRADHAEAQVKIHDLIVEQEQAQAMVDLATKTKNEAIERAASAEGRVVDAVNRANETADELRKANDRLKQARDKLKEADNRVRELETREPETVEVEVERVPEDVAAELERLKAELKKYQESETVTPVKEIEIKLRIEWLHLTQGFEGLVKLVGELNQRDPDKGKNYAGAVMKLCDAMKAKCHISDE